MEKYRVATDGKILNCDSREEAFGEQILAFRISLIGIFLFNMNVKDAIRTVDGSQFKISRMNSGSRN